MQSILFWGGLASMLLSFVIGFGQWFTFSVISHAQQAASSGRAYDDVVTDLMRKNEAKGRPEPIAEETPELADPIDEWESANNSLRSSTGW